MQPRLRGWFSIQSSGWSLAGYALAPVSAAICLLLGLGFYQEFKPIPFMPFVPAIAICAGFGGLGPGLAALAFSAAGALYLFALDDFPESSFMRLAFFMAAAGVITVLSTLLRHMSRAAAAARQELHLARELETEAGRQRTEILAALESERQARLRAEAALAAAQANCAECPASPNPLREGLSARELDVLRLVAEGLTNATAAERLVVSPYTVNMHLRSIYAKLGVSSRSAAVRYAVDHKLV